MQMQLPVQLPVQPPTCEFILWRGGVPFSAECVLCLRFFSLHSTHGMSVENARDVLQAKFTQHPCPGSHSKTPTASTDALRAA